MDILQRLKERKLVQWALAYLAGSWFALEVFDLFDDRFGWPSWLFLLVLVVLAVGFLLTLVLAWYHGEQGRQRVSGPELLIIAGLLLVAGLLSSVFLGDGTSAADAQPETSIAAAPNDERRAPRIAVLPLANRGREEHQPFVDGIHDEIMSQLSKIGSLELTPLTSVLQYGESPENARAIGEELGAQYLVEGSVQRVESEVRVRVRLVEAADNRVVWDDDYDRDFTVAALFDLQRDIALSIATSLGAEVLPAEADRLQVPGPENLAAYELYLDGLTHLRAIQTGISGRVHDDAIKSFSDAIAEEPGWAPPHAALGATYHWIASRRIDPEENYARSLAALEAALQIDSLHAPAWESLGIVRHWWERDFEAADDAYLRSRELGSTTTWGRALLMWSWGRFDEAISEFQDYLTLDPVSPVARTQLGELYLCVGSYDLARVNLERGIDSFGFAAAPVLAATYFKLGRTQDGVSQLQDLPVDTWGPESLSYVNALAGRTEVAEQLLREAEAGRAGEAGARGAGYAAATALVLGDEERALAYLEAAAASSSFNMLYIYCPEEIRTLEGNARFERVLDRIGYPQRTGS